MTTSKTLRLLASLALIAALAAPAAQGQDKPRPGGVLTRFDSGGRGRPHLPARSPPGGEMVDANPVQSRRKSPAGPFLPSLPSAWCRVAAKHILVIYGDLNQPE